MFLLLVPPLMAALKRGSWFYSPWQPFAQPPFYDMISQSYLRSSRISQILSCSKALRHQTFQKLEASAMSSSRASMRVEYVAAKYCKDSCGSLSPHPNRPLSKEITQQARDVRNLFPRHHREAPQHTPPAVAPQALQISPPIMPDASLQKTVSASGPLHCTIFDDDVSDPANVDKHVKRNSVGHLTSFLLKR